MSGSSLTATDVSVEFSGLRALDSVSLSLAASEIVGLSKTIAARAAP